MMTCTWTGSKVKGLVLCTLMGGTVAAAALVIFNLEGGEDSLAAGIWAATGRAESEVHRRFAVVPKPCLAATYNINIKLQSTVPLVPWSAVCKRCWYKWCMQTCFIITGVPRSRLQTDQLLRSHSIQRKHLRKQAISYSHYAV